MEMAKKLGDRSGEYWNNTISGRSMVKNSDLNFDVQRLDECRIPSPIRRVGFVSEDAHLLFHSNARDVGPFLKVGKNPLLSR